MVIDREVSELQDQLRLLKLHLKGQGQVTQHDIERILDAVILLGHRIRAIDATIFHMKTGGTTFS